MELCGVEFGPVAPAMFVVDAMASGGPRLDCDNHSMLAQLAHVMVLRGAWLVLRGASSTLPAPGMRRAAQEEGTASVARA